jgi:hypothetical protein
MLVRMVSGSRPDDRDVAGVLLALDLDLQHLSVHHLDLHAGSKRRGRVVVCRKAEIPCRETTTRPRRNLWMPHPKPPWPTSGGA